MDDEGWARTSWMVGMETGLSRTGVSTTTEGIGLTGRLIGRKGVEWTKSAEWAVGCIARRLKRFGVDAVIFERGSGAFDWEESPRTESSALWAGNSKSGPEIAPGENFKSLDEVLDLSNKTPKSDVLSDFESRWRDAPKVCRGKSGTASPEDSRRLEVLEEDASGASCQTKSAEGGGLLETGEAFWRLKGSIKLD